MSKQPWYHRSNAVLFTATQPITEEQFTKAVEKALKKYGVLRGTVEVECINMGDHLVSGWMEPEPGDPADL